MERKIVSLFHKVSGNNLPYDRVKVMKEVIKSIGPRVSQRRMVKEFAVEFHADALKGVGAE
jgi:glucan phosphorylase